MSDRESQYGRTSVVKNLQETEAHTLTRVRFEKDSGSAYNERWLQEFISRYPSVLPIDQIESSLSQAVSICMELPINGNSLFVDNLFVTPDGDLIVAETKLYRNPEARRAVVSQVMEYAKYLSMLSYEELETAIHRAQLPDATKGSPAARLYELVKAGVASSEAPDEVGFIDAVSRNLRRGRFLLLVIGDGIQEGTENITQYLQQHAGMHFTFGLVDLAIFHLPTELAGYLVQPRVLARTQNIDRGVVTIENDRITVRAPAHDAFPLAGYPKRTTISSEKFYEALSESMPNAVPALKAFTARLEPLGIELDFGKESMILRGRTEANRAWNLAMITKGGKIWTDQIGSQANAVGLIDQAHTYLRELAAAVPGARVKETPSRTAWYVVMPDGYMTIDQLLPHADRWIAAMLAFLKGSAQALDRGNIKERAADAA